MDAAATFSDPGELARGGNALLARMPADCLAFLARKCRRVRLARGDDLTAPDQPIAAANFIESGVVSVVKPNGRGERTEICLLGPESFTGGPIVTADGRWPYRAFVRTEAAVAVSVPAEQLRVAFARSEPLRALLLGATHLLTIQIAEGLVSAAWQALPARLARWLLMFSDRLGSDRVEVTHGFIAMMIGSQRPGVTLALHELEGAGLIGVARGLVLIRDRPKLRQLAGDGYGVPEREWERLLPRP